MKKHDHRDAGGTRVALMCAVDFTAWHFLRPLAKALRAEGFDVTILCGDGEYVERLRNEERLRVLINPIARSLNPFAHIAELIRTYRILREERFDVVHVHTPIAALVGRVAAWAAGIPVRIYTAHGFYFHEGMSPLKRWMHIFLEWLGARFGHFIMTVSGEDEEAAIRYHISRPGRVETIANGVDVTWFDPSLFTSEDRARFRAQWGIPRDAVVIGFVGRLVKEKGILELVRAFAELVSRHGSLRLLIVGDVLQSDYDAGKDEFFSLAKALGVFDRIAFTGMVDDTRPCLAAMDIFCLPSYREGMPVSLLEAMAMERACVATDIRGCREEIVNRESGLLVPPRNAEALVQALDSLVSDPSLMRSLGKSARARILEKFDETKVLRHQIAIYRRLLGQ